MMNCEKTMEKYKEAYLGRVWVKGTDHDEHLLYSYSKLLELVMDDG